MPSIAVITVATCFKFLQTPYCWQCWHSMRSRVYQTARCPSGRLSVRLSVCLSHSTAAAACGGFAAGAQRASDRSTAAATECPAAAARSTALSGKREQCHVYSWRRRLNTVLLALCRRRLSRHVVRLRQQQRLWRSASIERIVVNRLSRSLRPKLRLYFLRLRSGKQAGPPLLSARGRPTAVGSLRGKSDRRQTLQPSHQLRSAIFTFKKVAHTRLPSFGCPSWSRFLAVSLQVTWVINPAVGCHYFPPGPHLSSQPLRGLLPTSLLGEQRHDGCEQFS